MFTASEKLYDDEGKPRFGREYDLDEACKRLDISIKTYKAWEKKGLIPEVSRNPITGYRVLIDEDMAKVRVHVLSSKSHRALEIEILLDRLFGAVEKRGDEGAGIGITLFDALGCFQRGCERGPGCQ